MQETKKKSRIRTQLYTIYTKLVQMYCSVCYDKCEHKYVYFKGGKNG